MTAPIYRIGFEPDDNGTLMVTCEAFPEMVTYGGDKAQAVAHAKGAIEEAIAARIHYSRDIPPFATADERTTHEARVKLPALTGLKVELYRLSRARGVNRAELSRRLGWHREQVDRLFRIDHASRLDQLEAAFQALSQEVEFQLSERKALALSE